MSEQIQTSEETSNGMDRRSVLKRGALLAGVAAFAQPVVAGVFSSRASAAINACTPENESDAVDILQGQLTTWNVNCKDTGVAAPYGRYNSQRSSWTIPGTSVQVSVVIGEANTTDNFPVQCSYYRLEEPTGWECTALFDTATHNRNSVCGDIGIEYVADVTSPTCAALPNWSGNLGGAIGLPYCVPPPAQGNDSQCPSNFFLHLVSFYCCPVSTTP